MVGGVSMLPVTGPVRPGPVRSGLAWSGPVHGHRWGPTLSLRYVEQFLRHLKRFFIIFGFFQKIGFLRYLGAPGALGWF